MAVRRKIKLHFNSGVALSEGVAYLDSISTVRALGDSKTMVRFTDNEWAVVYKSLSEVDKIISDQDTNENILQSGDLDWRDITLSEKERAKKNAPKKSLKQRLGLKK